MNTGNIVCDDDIVCDKIKDNTSDKNRSIKIDLNKILNKREEEEYEEWFKTHENKYSNRCFSPDRMEQYFDKINDE